MTRWLLLVLIVCTGCEEVGPPAFTGPVVLGGASIAPEVLNKGRDSYNHYCRSCHGPLGDGKGPLGLHQKPPARDLRLGIIKYASVASGSLPTDADLAGVIQRGIRGTAMLPWVVPKADLDAVVHYIKTFSPRWKNEKAGTPLKAGPDPWIANPLVGAQRGEELYHGAAKCVACHPAYKGEASGAKVTKSAFGQLRATDFKTDTLRNGTTLQDYYRVISTGVGGTAMPAWHGSLPDKDIWALAYYVRSQQQR